MSDTSLRPRRKRTRGLGIVGVIGEVLITAGLLVFLFLGWYFGVYDALQRAEQNQSATALSEQWLVPESTTPDPVETPAPEFGEGYAVLHVPRFGSDYAAIVAEGVELSVLDEYVGHFPDTAQPGEIGNFALAGHRTTYGKPFNLLNELVPGDAIVVETADGWYTYRDRSTEIVKPTAVDVLLPVPRQPDAEPTEALITLTACHPLFSAAERIVSYGVLESFTPRADGPPDSLAAPDGV